MKAIELRKKTKVELDKLLMEKRQELGELRIQANNRQLSDVSKISQAKKEIARILTIISSNDFVDNKSTK